MKPNHAGRNRCGSIISETRLPEGMVATRAILTSLPLFLAVVASTVGANSQDAEIDVPSFEVQLDPAALLRETLETGVITLPTAAGPVTFTTLTRDLTPVTVLDADQPLSAPRLHVSNVWDMRNAEGDYGTMLLRADRLQAILHTANGVINLEPTDETVGDVRTSYSVSQPDSNPRPEGSPDGFEAAEEGEVEAAGEDDGTTGDGPTGDAATVLPYVPSTVAVTPGVTKTMIVYVDSEFSSQYGGLTWPDQVDYVITEANKRFLDVGLTYDVQAMSLDSTMDCCNINDAFDDLKTKSYSGEDVRGYMSERDFDGCTIGLGSQPGSTFLIQHDPDNCHGGSTPSTNFEKVYLTKHELGHNNNADHAYKWSKDLGYHVHRSIMHKSAWYHYHDIWSNANAQRMCTHLGTTCPAGTQAVNTNVDLVYDTAYETSQDVT